MLAERNTWWVGRRPYRCGRRTDDPLHTLDHSPSPLNSTMPAEQNDLQVPFDRRPPLRTTDLADRSQSPVPTHLAAPLSFWCR